MKAFHSFTLLVFALLIVSCKQVSDNAKVQIEEKAYDKLSDYHFFTGKLSDLQPNQGVLPYELITPLFTDYAHKKRFVWMPKDSFAVYNNEEVFDFPVGTALIKNFYYPADFRKPEGDKRIIETRILIRKIDGWDALPYVWNDEQTEAYLKVVGGDAQVDWINEKGENCKVNYSIPNKNQCKSCHWINGKFSPIGPKARNINCDMVYHGQKRNQLEMWSVQGYLKGQDCPAMEPKVAKWDDSTSGSLEERARAYLDVNCAHCHRAEGPANTSGLFLTYNETSSEKLGFFKTPVAAGRGAGENKYDLVPGHAEQSILIHRMNSIDPGVMMPELGRKMIHKEGVELISNWINSLPEEKIVTKKAN